MGLGKIINIIRGAAIVILLLHFYYYCYDAFYDWGLVSKFSDQLLINIKNTGLFNSFHSWGIILPLILSKITKCRI